jgi:EAL domain-containing protein (putative c-di-GMP-specific phosphodiesterase class I)
MPRTSGQSNRPRRKGRSASLAPEFLELEITEDIALNYEEAAKPLARLREQGVKLAFDDFGTGFASLRYLTLFPVSRIKIDRSFVKGGADDPKSATIVRSLLSMARSLGLEVIAEGVETSAQSAWLRSEHCDEAQGYLYSRPLSAPDFARYLKVAQLAVAAGFGDTAEVAGRGGVRQANNGAPCSSAANPWAAPATGSRSTAGREGR